jgi:hypothetical protein
MALLVIWGEKRERTEEAFVAGVRKREREA